MSVIKTITDEYYFWNWLKNSDSYGNNFSLEGSKAVFNYFDQLGEEQIEFDPIAWCCEFSEYDSFKDFQHDTGYTLDGKQYKGYPNIKTIEDLQDHATVIELDNGGLVVSEF